MKLYNPNPIQKDKDSVYSPMKTTLMTPQIPYTPNFGYQSS